MAKKSEIIGEFILTINDDNSITVRMFPAKATQEWLKDQFLTTEERTSYLRNNFIDEDFILTWENFPKFEEMRKDRIKKELMRIFKINGIQ